MKLIKIYIKAFSAILLLSCSQNEQLPYHNIIGFAQGTTYNIVYSDSLNRNFKPEIDSILQNIDLSLSTYVSASLISRFNEYKDTTLFEIDRMFYDNLFLSKQVNKITEGAFDPTVLPLYKYFKFESNDSLGIDPLKVDSIKQNIGINNVELISRDNKFFVKKTNLNLVLDFNAIAQGYSVDIIADFLKSKLVCNYMIELGGEVLAKGNNPNQKLWRIGIERPTYNKENEAQKIVELNNEALATSGSYRKYKQIGNKKYSHAIDPITGYPVSHNLLSVSVISNTCAEADAYATAFLVLGKEKSLEIIKKNSIDVKGLFIESGEKEEFVETNF